MSNINDLIQQYCPNGCEYKSLSEISDRIKAMTGVSNKWAENGNCQFIDYLNAYNHLKIDVSLRPFATVKKLEQMPLMTGDILITSASETPDECALSAVIEDEIDDNTFLDDHLFGIRIKPEYKTLVNPSYVNYYFHSKDFRKILPKAVRGVTRYYVSLPEFMELEIPVPPLPVQEEIVRILDKFTELEQELEQELELRKKQYEYYRDKMLSLEDYDGEVEYKMLGEVVTRKITKGTTPTTIGYSFMPDGVNFIKVETIGANGEFISSKMEHISDECNDKMARSQLEEFDIMFSIAGAIGKIIMVTNDVLPANTNQALAIIRLDRTIFNPYYVKYYLETSMAASEYLVMKTGAAQPNVSLESLGNVHIPHVSMDEQNRIVEKLDKFSTLASDIFEGLPAEIKMRHQQYEYYRDKLLNFKRLEVV